MILKKSRQSGTINVDELSTLQPTAGAFMAKVKTGGITARSGTTLGSGTANVLQITTGSTLSTTSLDVTVYNLGTTAAAVDDYVTIIQEHVTGKWILTAVS
jgi:hypothetical protein